MPASQNPVAQSQGSPHAAPLGKRPLGGAVHVPWSHTPAAQSPSYVECRYGQPCDTSTHTCGQAYDGQPCARDVECTSDTCDNGTCVGRATGSPCTYDTECVGGLCVCGQAGHCPGVSGGICGPVPSGPCSSNLDCVSGVCNGGSCGVVNGTACTGDSVCLSGLCLGGVCQAKMAAGSACTADDRCSTGMCNGGVCVCLGGGTR